MIAARDLSVGAGQFALGHISFEIPTGAYAVLMGRTGSGKTTLLETIAGLHKPRGGQVWIMGNDATGLKPAARAIGYVPQDRALFPTMTISQHLSFALELRKMRASDIARRVEELADLLQIRGLLKRRPQGLSGGEAQRVALGRALSFSPNVLLLDEPLSALDDQTRAEICQLLRTVRSVTGVTTLHVTHHREDARQLADQLLILEAGAVRSEAA